MPTGARLCTSLSAFLLLSASPSLSSGELEVEKRILGPLGEGGIYVLNADASCAAYVGMQGTRQVVSVEGVAGPKFDEIYLPSGKRCDLPQQTQVTTAGLRLDTPVIFTEDGKHWAYIGRQGSQYVVIKDGVEVARGESQKLGLHKLPLGLSPKGTHVVWAEFDPQHNPAPVRVFASGVPGPWCSLQGLPFFSADEARYAYTAGLPQVGDGMVVLDGQPAGYAARAPMFTSDGQHLLGTSVPTSEGQSLLVDGVPVVHGRSIGEIVVAPVGSRWAACVQTDGASKGELNFELYVDGKQVPDTPALKVQFSPDGKRWAAKCMNFASRSQYLVIDGEKLEEYPDVADSGWRWTSDGSSLHYFVMAGGRQFLIADGEEVAIREKLFAPMMYAEQEDRYLLAMCDAQGRNVSLSLNGVDVLPAGANPNAPTLTLSPDGLRLAYSFGSGSDTNSRIWVDGQVIEGPTIGGAKQWLSGRAPSFFTFSPDSRHLVFVGVSSDIATSGLYLDGQLVFPGLYDTIYPPLFTPDSKHLVWCAEQDAGQPTSGVHKKTRELELYVDGQLAVRAPQAFRSFAPALALGDDGSIAMLAADGNSVVRYLVVPGATSIDTLLEQGSSREQMATPAA